jgi:hypothetical protein
MVCDAYDKMNHLSMHIHYLWLVMECNAPPPSRRRAVGHEIPRYPTDSG